MIVKFFAAAVAQKWVDGGQAIRASYKNNDGHGALYYINALVFGLSLQLLRQKKNSLLLSKCKKRND